MSAIIIRPDFNPRPRPVEPDDNWLERELRAAAERYTKRLANLRAADGERASDGPTDGAA